MNGREAAFLALIKFERGKTYINMALNEVFSQNDISGLERSFATELTYGCLKNRLLLDYVISRFSKIKIRKMSAQVRTILEIGAFQIIMLDRVPDSAACDESVKLARKFAGRSRGFVNGVLRSLCRGKNDIVYPDRADDEAEYLSITLSFPKWIVEHIISDYGTDTCEKILSAANKAYPPYIRQNRLKKRDNFIALIKADGISAEPDSEIEGCFKVHGGLNISESDTYKNGLFTVQNRSSQLATLALEPKPGMFVIDMCAAPGGKTTHIAELMDNRGEIRAFDIHKHKIGLINAAAERLGIDIITAEALDASVPVSDYIGKADRVLLDAPCSGLGVIHSKPDIRWTRREGDIEELVKIQRGLLETAAKYVKSGGIMVYSTCTILKAENERQIERFLEKHSDFKLVSQKTLLTHETEGSGFYIAKLFKT